jgi:hypothetical protein
LYFRCAHPVSRRKSVRQYLETGETDQSRNKRLTTLILCDGQVAFKVITIPTGIQAGRMFATNWHGAISVQLRSPPPAGFSGSLRWRKNLPLFC